MDEIRREDCDTYQEYVRLKYKIESKLKRHDIRLSRFALVLAKIREYERDGLSDVDIVMQLAKHYEYKLVEDKDVKKT